MSSFLAPELEEGAFVCALERKDRVPRKECGLVVYISDSFLDFFVHLAAQPHDVASSPSPYSSSPSGANYLADSPVSQCSGTLQWGHPTQAKIRIDIAAESLSLLLHALCK